MSYNGSNLSVLAYANKFTLWHYTTTDSSITAAGYFNNAVDMLRLNDLLIATTETGATSVTKTYIVTDVGDSVTVSVYA